LLRVFWQRQRYWGNQGYCARSFKLREISIVLVIMGLIVGGVRVGQNLIASATVRAHVTL
jgi:hypothetical protein